MGSWNTCRSTTEARREYCTSIITARYVPRKYLPHKKFLGSVLNPLYRHFLNDRKYKQPKTPTTVDTTKKTVPSITDVSTLPGPFLHHLVRALQNVTKSPHQRKQVYQVRLRLQQATWNNHLNYPVWSVHQCFLSFKQQHWLGMQASFHMTNTPAS